MGKSTGPLGCRSCSQRCATSGQPSSRILAPPSVSPARSSAARESTSEPRRWLSPFLLLRCLRAGPCTLNSSRSSSQASVSAWVLALDRAPPLCHGWTPRFILAKACAPGAVGLPLQVAARPYALLAVKAPHLRQNRIGISATVRAMTCPLALMASTRTEGLSPGHGWAASEGVMCSSKVSFRQHAHRQKPPANDH